MNRALLAAGLLGAAGAAGIAVAATRPRAASGEATDTPFYRGGSGSPILLLHGISVTWRCWKPVLPLLEQAGHEVVAPTLLGHSGAADFAPGTAPSVDALADGVEQFLDEQGLGRVHVVGNSLGGWLSLELARRGRARSVVAFSPAGAWSSAAAIRGVMAVMHYGLNLVTHLGPSADRLAASPLARRLLCYAQVEHPERLDPAEVAADIRGLAWAPGVQPLLKVLGDAPMQPLPDPGCPIRVVWARRDRLIPYRSFGAPLLDRLPTAELIFLENVGHVPMSDDPRSVARLILEMANSVDRITQAGA
ncbi:alpha/beta hydrolase [Pseudonocardia eucalypti]|uniref:Alpha/beta hydrolase n=1 Tax=Pseudonocardia eucalypti TaxID=648755 RepID=A0ABP9Q052_9PSEU|nr:pimeloyl-ACP methyl ester carboxylesterase [Pseudonocardia eucalypti]